MRLAAFQPGGWIAWLAMATATGVFAQAGRPIEYSEPHPNRARTNLNQLEPGRSGLDRLESELVRPFDFLSRGNSMEGRFLPAPLPAPPPAINTARIRELIERREDLPFMTTDEVFRLNPDAERFKAPELTPDGRDRNRLRPLERALLESDVTDPIRLGADPRARNQREPADRSAESDWTTPSLRPWEAAFRESSPPGFTRPASRFDPPGQRPWDNDFGSEFRRPTAGLTRPSETELQRIEAFRQLYDFNDSRPPLTGQELMRGSASYLDRSFYDPPVAAVAPVVVPRGILAGGAPAAVPAYTPAPASPPPASSTLALPPPSSPFGSVPPRPF